MNIWSFRTAIRITSQRCQTPVYQTLSRVAPSETIQDAVDAEFVEGPSALVIEEPSTTSPPTRAQAEATYSPDVTMEIPDSSQVSLLSSPYEERNLTSDAGYTSTSHEANLPAVTEHAQEEQTEGQSRDDQPSQDSSKSESQIDPHSSSQLDIVQQPSGSTPNLLEPPKDKRIVSPMHSLVTTRPS